MHDLVKAMSASASGMRAQGVRLRLIGENVANADTPGFHRKLVAFEAGIDARTGANTVETGPLTHSPKPMREAYEPGHPLADARGIVAYSNVDTLIEIADAREAQRSYQANVTVFDQARRMYSSMLDLLRS